MPVYEVQRLKADGKVFDVRPENDKVRPYAPGDRALPFEVVKQTLTTAQAEALMARSVVGGGDGFTKDMNMLADEADIARLVTAKSSDVLASFTDAQIIAEAQRRKLVVKAI